MRVRLRYSRQGGCRFLSHLDMVRVFVRALRRGRIPVAYSGGFNPQPRLAFAAPLAVGTTGLSEYVEIYLKEKLSIGQLLEDINRQLPDGIAVLAGLEVPEGEESLMARLNVLAYDIELPDTNRQTVEDGVQSLMQAEEIMVFRKTKKGYVERDIKPYIFQISLVDGDTEGEAWRLELIIKTRPEGSVRPEEVLKAMDIKDEAIIVRKGTFIHEEDRLFTPFDGMDGEVLFWKKRLL